MLLNLVEGLKRENAELREQVQELREEVNRLKGEPGKPKIKSGKKGKRADHSSEPGSIWFGHSCSGDYIILCHRNDRTEDRGILRAYGGLHF